MGIRLMAVGAQCLGDNLGTDVIYPNQQKMKKMQGTKIRPIAVGAQRTDYDLRLRVGQQVYKRSTTNGKKSKNC